MPRRFHKQADFNVAEMEKIKKLQGDKTDYRFFRECVLNECSRSETPRKEQGGSESRHSSSENRRAQEGNGALQASDSGDPFED